MGLELRVGLRLVDAQSAVPLVGVPVEVWHADHGGRYAGFAPFTPRPGEVVTSASVPNEVVAPWETFLRGMQRTDEDGICVFETIYPGWYATRTVHIHVADFQRGAAQLASFISPTSSPTKCSPAPHTPGVRRVTPPTPPIASSPTAAHEPCCG